MVLIDEEKYNEAQQYLSVLLADKIDSVKNFVNAGNDVIYAIINHKISLCDKQNIKVMCTTANNLKIQNSIDIFSLLSNLFDNAIEACKKY